MRIYTKTNYWPGMIKIFIQLYTLLAQMLHFVSMVVEINLGNMASFLQENFKILFYIRMDGK